MKKFLGLLLLFLACSAGCENGSRQKVTGANADLFFYKVTHDGHKYIVAKWGNNGGTQNGAGMVHDPDCPCNK